MKPSVVPMLRCPVCRASLRLEARDAQRFTGTEDDVVSGALRCVGCTAHYAITAGIPRLLPPAGAAVEGERRWTASRFGYLWARSASTGVDTRCGPYHLEKLQHAVGLAPPRGMVLDAGCGEGIDVANVAALPGVDVIGVELSDGGCAASFARTRHLLNAHVIQGDLRSLPLADDRFDLVYSYGVVHHMTAPNEAAGEMVRVTRPRGVVAIYLYEDFATRAPALRLGLAVANRARGLTTRLPPRVLFSLCQIASPVVYATFTVPHLLLRNVPGLRAFAGGLPFRHGPGPLGLVGDLYDRFSAPIERRFSRADAADLLLRAGLVDVRVGYERGWVATGVKPESRAS